MDAVIFIGIQASGKTTFYKERFFNTHIRISLDMLKTRYRERLIMLACIEAKQPFVIDNTNVLISERNIYITAARSAGFKVTGYYFRSSLKESIIRNSQRSGKHFIPIKGIGGTLKRLERPNTTEGFDKIYYVSISSKNEFIVEDYTAGSIPFSTDNPSTQ